MEVEDTCELTSATVRSPSEIALEALFDGWRYTIVLTSLDGLRFVSDFTSMKGGDRQSGVMHASLYLNGNNFLLYGKWIEYGDEYHVIVRFSCINRSK